MAFVSMILYFLRMFLCAYNADDINSKGRITMIWSALMWFTSLEGVSYISKNNLIRSCLGGIFWSSKKVKQSTIHYHRATGAYLWDH